MKKLITTLTLVTTSLFAYNMGFNFVVSNYDISQTNNQAINLGDNMPKSKATGAELFLSTDCLFFDNPSLKNYLSV